MNNIVVSELAIYPVKSMRQVLLDSTSIALGGLKDDRRWMVVDADGRMITQRQQPRLCLIQPVLIDDGICLQTEGFPSLTVSIPDGKKMKQVSIWKDSCNAYVADVDADQWLSEFLGLECSLVYFSKDEMRVVDQRFARVGDLTAFSDGFPVLITSQASLDDLNARLDSPIPMTRFRPNIVLSGCEAFAEDKWHKLKIGDLNVRLVKPCSRCVIPSIDIATAERSDEPTKTLSSYRKQNNRIIFGQNAVVDGEGQIKTGMAVEVVSI